jgi:hypothetical protein
MPSKWVATAQPSADLTPVYDKPEVKDDGTEVTVFQTRFGARFAKVVEPHGIVYWLKEVIV